MRLKIALTGLQADGEGNSAGGSNDEGDLHPVSRGGCGDGSCGHALPCNLIHRSESHDDGSVNLLHSHTRESVLNVLGPEALLC